MSDIAFSQLQSIPPSSQAIVTGENLTGKPSLSTTENHAASFLETIWSAIPFGPLISKVPSVSTAAKGVAIGAVTAGKGVANSAASAAKGVSDAAKSTVGAVTGGLEKGLIIVVVLVAGYLLLPVLLARRA